MDVDASPASVSFPDLTDIPRGTSADVNLLIGERSTGISVCIPVHVRHGEAEGPTVLVTAALHGDELNGTGAVRELILDRDMQLARGKLILVPVLNMLGYDSHSRYMPDRRDLNRAFPGSGKGSFTARLAKRIYRQLVERSDWVIDLHTAAVRRTNYPNVRANLDHPGTKWLAESFGCQLTIHGEGPKGSLRQVATTTGHPTITFEGGEVWKVEPIIVEHILRGVRNVLSDLRMIDAPSDRPHAPCFVRSTRWVRADRGGFLQFHVAPGTNVEEGQPLATNTSLLGHEQNVLVAPCAGIVIGMTTLPAVSTGEAVCHLGQLSTSETAEFESGCDAMRQQAQEDLATNVRVVEPRED